MRKYSVLAVLLGVLLFPVCACANDLQVTAISMLSRDTSNPTQANHTRAIQFTAAWSNSWCMTGGACAGAVTNADANWDAAWLFVKYSVYAGGAWGPWLHCTLAASGHTAPSGSQITPTADGKGAFLYRNAAGLGANTFTNTALVWKYGADGVADTAAVKVRVFGVEMVYIPAGAFKAGDFATGDGAFKGGTADTTPWPINDESAITTTNTASGGYYYVLGSGAGTGADATGAVFTIPGAFPKGTSAFYIMKYKLSQGMYRDFLNTLSRVQQQGRIGATIASGDTSVTNRYVMANNTTVQYRNGIRAPAAFTANLPITFGCDLDANGTFNEATDGEWIAANWVNWGDVAAFADWAGLRPFTELEYEKAARGVQSPLAGEYAWGSTSYVNTAAVDGNAGKKSELPSTTSANVLVSGGLSGPIRCGAFARSGSTLRSDVGASVYGVMELSGTLWERPVTVGHATGRAFTGLHGNGALDSAGKADVVNWPLESNALGSGLRGGSWLDGLTNARVSDRSLAAFGSSVRYVNFGARLARTSP